MKFLFIFIISLSLYASNGLKLTPLFPGESEVLLTNKDLKKKFFLFFKPQCSSCRRQVKDLACLPKGSIHFMAFAADESELRKEARLMGLWKRTYLADKSVRKVFSILKDDSPVLFAFNKDGKVKRWLGEKSCQDILYFMEG